MTRFRLYAFTTYYGIGVQRDKPVMSMLIRHSCLLTQIWSCTVSFVRNCVAILMSRSGRSLSEGIHAGLPGFLCRAPRCHCQLVAGQNSLCRRCLCPKTMSRNAGSTNMSIDARSIEGFSDPASNMRVTKGKSQVDRYEGMNWKSMPIHPRFVNAVNYKWCLPRCCVICRAGLFPITVSHFIGERLL